MPKLEPIAVFLNRNLGWLFLFKQGNVLLARRRHDFHRGHHRAVGDDPAYRHIDITRVFRQQMKQRCARRDEMGVRMTVRYTGRSGGSRPPCWVWGGAETVAVPGHRARPRAGDLVAVRRRLYVRFQDRSAASEFRRTAADRSLHFGGTVFVLTSLVNAAARAIAGGKVNGRVPPTSIEALDQPESR